MKRGKERRVERTNGGREEHVVAFDFGFVLTVAGDRLLAAAHQKQSHSKGRKMKRRVWGAVCGVRAALVCVCVHEFSSARAEVEL